MNKIFQKSYDDIRANLKAISDRGWYPANRKLLEHKALFDDTIASPADTASSPDTSTTATESGTFTVNIETGKGAILLDRMISERARSAAGKKVAETCKRNGDLITQNLQDAKNLST